MIKSHTRNIISIILALACSAWAFGGDKAGRKEKAANASAAMCARHQVSAKDSKAGADPEAIAVVDGQPIYKKDLTGPEAAQIFKISQQEYKIESQALDELIRQKVVEAEAQKQGLTVDQLYQKEVDSKISEPSDEQAKGYYLAVKDRTTLPFSDVAPEIKRMIKNLEIQQARDKYADSLRAKADVAVYLQPPTVDLGDNDPLRIEGNPQAPITIVEFGDFQCPYCGRAEPTVIALLKKYDGKVKLAFRDFPLSTIHPYAEGAAQAGRCAEAQGKFWPMHDAIYADQSKLTEDDLVKTAARLGLDQKAFAVCLKSDKYEDAIQQDVAAGNRAGVTGTPSFFINGQFLSGSVPEAQFDQIIDSELAALKNQRRAVASR